MALKGVKVGSSAYHFDYAYLENAPIPASPSNSSISVSEELCQVLARDGNDIVWMPVFPDTTDCEGNVLTVDDCGYPTWTSQGDLSSLPAYDTIYPSSDAGKALVVNESGGLAWESIDAGGLPNIPTGQTATSTLIITAGSNGDTVGWEEIRDVFLNYTSYGENGDILVYGSEGVSWETMAHVPPAGENGLLVSDCSDGVHWAGWDHAIANVFPSFDENDAGKVLTVLNDGTMGWA